MDSRVVFFARDDAEQQILVAMELEQEERQIVLYTFPHNLVNEALLKQLNEEWKTGKEFSFPEDCKRETRSFSEEHLLPASIKPDNPESLRRLRHEWTLRLLSVRLFESIKEEVAKLSGQLAANKAYSKDLWEEAKTEWSKITEHAKERNLLRSQVDMLRGQLNALFEDLKKLRDADQDQYAEQSAAVKKQFDDRLQAFEKEFDPQKDNINHRFDQLKKLQAEVKEAKLTHKDRRKVWKSVDHLFHKLKSARAAHFQSHLVNRHSGLEKAIGKMEHSIGKDRKELEFQHKKMAHSSQLEFQLREAKIKVIEDRVRSKEEKLADMHRTLQHLKKKIKTAKPETAKAAPETKPAAAEEQSLPAPETKPAAAEEPSLPVPETKPEAAAEEPSLPDPENVKQQSDG